MHSDREKLVEHLKVRLKLKYAANCKCGSCQCVPIADLHEAIAALSEPVKDEPVAWHRSTDGAGSILLYTLRQDGWRRGEPVMVNDAMVRVEAANGSQTPIEPIAERILSALTRPAGERPAVAVEALREALDETSLRAKISEIGNQVHNLGCELQNDEVHSERLGYLASELWSLAALASRAGETPASSPHKEGSGDA